MTQKTYGFSTGEQSLRIRMESLLKEYKQLLENPEYRTGSSERFSPLAWANLGYITDSLAALDQKSQSSKEADKQKEAEKNAKKGRALTDTLGRQPMNAQPPPITEFTLTGGSTAAAAAARATNARPTAATTTTAARAESAANTIAAVTATVVTAGASAASASGQTGEAAITASASPATSGAIVVYDGDVDGAAKPKSSKRTRNSGGGESSLNLQDLGLSNERAAATIAKSVEKAAETRASESGALAAALSQNTAVLANMIQAQQASFKEQQASTQQFLLGLAKMFASGKKKKKSKSKKTKKEDDASEKESDSSSSSDD
jgi:hypothetical protein